MMSKLILSHVAIGAYDVEESARFYIDLFGDEHVERLPTPALASPDIDVVWLRLGPVQLHLGQRGKIDRDTKDHFGVGISDAGLFHDIYRKAKERGILQPLPFGHHIYELPGGDVQMFLVDPAGNTFEVDYPYGSDLDTALIDDLQRMSERYVQPIHATQVSTFFSPMGKSIRPPEEPG